MFELEKLLHHQILTFLIITYCCVVQVKLKINEGIVQSKDD